MNGPAELAKGWIAKADSDLATAERAVSAALRLREQVVAELPETARP